MNVFKDVQFDATIRQGDNEAGSLLAQIETSLTEAGWNQIDWKSGDIVLSRPNRPKIGASAGIGVVINVNPSDEAAYWEAAKSLAAELAKSGIETRPELAELAETVPNMNPKTIHIFVGEKPL
jgi:hypothetical protein